MQSRSSAWEVLAASGYFVLETKAVIGTVTYTQISTPIIKRGLFQDSLSVGNCTAASLQVSIRTNDAIPRSAEVKIYQRLLSEAGGTATEWLPAGSFFVASRSRDYASGIITLQCYDAMLKTREDYFPDGVITGTWPKTMTEVVSEIAQRIGVSVDARTSIRTESRYQVGVPGELTLMDVLGYIGAVHGGNWIITEEGKLRLVPLTDAPTATSTDAYEVTAILGSLQTGKTMTVSRITMTVGEGEEAVTYTAGDDTGYELVIKDNPYATQDICDDLLDTLDGTVYAPFSADGAIYDPAIELGDKIIYGGTLYSTVVQEDRTLGVAYRSTVSAPADEEIEDEYPYISGIAKESRKVQQSIDDARKVANNYLSSDNTGVMVADMTDGTVQTPSQATGRNVFIDPDSVDIREGQDVLASFGESVIVGKEEEAHLNIDATGITGIDKDGLSVFAIGSNNADRTIQVTKTNGFTFLGEEVSKIYPVPKASTYTRIRRIHLPITNPVSGTRVRFYFYLTSSSTSAGPVTKLTDTFVDFVYGEEAVERVISVGMEYYLSFDYSGGASLEISGYRPTSDTRYSVDFGIKAVSYYEVTDGASFTFGTREEVTETVIVDGEGNPVTAGIENVVGDFSAAFGTDNVSSGACSFSDGQGCRADADNAHAQNRGTVAASANQTAMGKFNEADSSGTYALIIGNGARDNARSNAFTVDWDGNAQMALDETASSGTIDGDLCAAIKAFVWEGEVIG